MAWPFSILILTLNEEKDLPRCLASVRDCDDIVVLDSGSTDRTAALARAAGARVLERAFDNFAGQRNFAQQSIPFRHPWVFHLDADEEMTPELAAECSAVAGAGGAGGPENRGGTPLAPGLDGYFAAPKMVYEGRWIPHCTDYPAWQARFVRAPEFEFIETGHGQREAPAMRLGRLGANYLHDVTSGGEAEWLEKHRRYARAEARAHAEGSFAWGDLFSSQSLRRRRALKRLGASLPCRGGARFIYQYILRGGFLDGAPGFRYCCLLARYEGFIAEEMRHLTTRRRIDHAPL